MAAADDANGAVSRAERLVGLFHPRLASFGRLAPAEPASVPQPHRGLLDHRSHMTAAMERHHGGAVALRVVAHDGPQRGPADQEWYAREILLSGPSGQIVQYGIVRIDLSALSPEDAARVRGAAVPLGRILMAAGVLCDVHDVALLSVVPGPELAALIGEIPTFGRVATIRVDGRPAIELLEVVVDRGGR